MRRRTVKFLVTGTLLAGVAAIAAANAWIIRSARGLVFSDLMSAPGNDVALVLGTSEFTPAGATNRFFTGRIEVAARLYDAGKARHFLLSGKHTESYDEPGAMRDAMIAAGVPETALTLDGAGFRTLDSVARANAVFGLSQFTIVTDDFHAARAVFLAHHFGAAAIAVTSHPMSAGSSKETRMREIAARCRAWLDVYVLRQQPKVLGPGSRMDVAAPDFKTTADRVAEFGNAVRARMQPYFQAAGVDYPPAHLALVGLKAERSLQLYGANADSRFRLIRTFPVLAASGQPGPKLREGDRQVPEGIYRVELLHPNSRYHLALRVNYPNESDRVHAQHEGRTEPGTDIMIHGGDHSSGCLAVGDEAAEDLFVVTALARDRHIPVIIAPTDFRVHAFDPPTGSPPWTDSLYTELRHALADFPSS
ncbi:MAG: YdcF family protein [Verrucomicrobiota bacterium]|nr:YdcF family protein [Verrucomicrobiota bacterium]